jgi:hypothetical protein
MVIPEGESISTFTFTNKKKKFKSEQEQIDDELKSIETT